MQFENCIHWKFFVFSYSSTWYWWMKKKTGFRYFTIAFHAKRVKSMAFVNKTRVKRILRVYQLHKDIFCFLVYFSILLIGFECFFFLSSHIFVHAYTMKLSHIVIHRNNKCKLKPSECFVATLLWYRIKSFQFCIFNDFGCWFTNICSLRICIFIIIAAKWRFLLTWKALI